MPIETSSKGIKRKSQGSGSASRKKAREVKNVEQEAAKERQEQVYEEREERERSEPRRIGEGDQEGLSGQQERVEGRQSEGTSRPLKNKCPKRVRFLLEQSIPDELLFNTECSFGLEAKNVDPMLFSEEDRIRLLDVFDGLVPKGNIDFDNLTSDEALKLAVGILNKYTPALMTSSQQLTLALKDLDRQNVMLDKLGETNIRLEANNRRYAKQISDLKGKLDKAKEMGAILLRETEDAIAAKEAAEKKAMEAMEEAAEATREVARLRKENAALKQEEKTAEEKYFAKYRRTRRYRTKKEEKIIEGINLTRAVILEAHPDWDLDFLASRIKLKKDSSKKATSSELTPFVAEQPEFSNTVGSKTWAEKKAKKKEEREAEESGSEASVGGGGDGGGEGGGGARGVDSGGGEA